MDGWMEGGREGLGGRGLEGGRKGDREGGRECPRREGGREDWEGCPRREGVPEEGGGARGGRESQTEKQGMELGQRLRHKQRQR
jgi:hypothetical protein